MDEKLKVLVVDDDQQMVKTICDILRVKGHEALCAYCGEDAVEMVKNGGPECVLMDVKMPGIDGIEALKMIKCLTPDLPVLLMSAYATGEQAEEAKREGAFTILTKPVDLQLVLRFLSILRKDESVLIVDDDPDFCGTLGDILQARGYRVETETDAGNGERTGHFQEDTHAIPLEAGGAGHRLRRGAGGFHRERARNRCLRLPPEAIRDRRAGRDHRGDQPQ